MSKVAKATIGLMLATAIAKGLGFGRELVLASSYQCIVMHILQL